MSFEMQRGEFLITTDSSKMDISTIHSFLTCSYWAEGIDEATVRRSIINSLCFGMFQSERQIGFARVVTDRATFAYLADVFVIEAFRGRGLGKWLMDVITHHPELQGLRRWVLATRDAHELYRQFGFTVPTMPTRFMEKFDPNVYLRSCLADLHCK